MNGEKVGKNSQVKLKHGDSIKFGNCKLFISKFKDPLEYKLICPQIATASRDIEESTDSLPDLKIKLVTDKPL